MCFLREKELKVGDPVSIVGGEHCGDAGILTHIGTNGSCEVALTTPSETGTVYVDVWDFNVEKIVENSEPIKDSGERTEFESGAVRDMHSGKGDMLSVDRKSVV